MNAPSLPRPIRPLLASVLILFAPHPLRADPAPSVVISKTPSCSSPEQDAELRRALEIELAAMHVQHRWETPELSAAPTARISLATDCAATDGLIALRVWTNIPRLVVKRTLALRDVPEAARARTLALIISEALGPALAAQTTAPDADDTRAADETPARADARTAERRAANAPSMLTDAYRAGPLFTTADPYAPWGPLFTAEDPYSTPRRARLGGAAQARVILDGGAPLFGFEITASGPLSEDVDLSAETSYAAATTWSTDGDREVNWWNTSIGADLVNAGPVYSLALGPRLAFAHLTVGDPNDESGSAERTLVTAFGARAKFEIPVGEKATVQTMLATQRSLGVLALNHYTGLDRAFNGWFVSWGLGFGVEL
jgi:hypothetical protein